MLRAPVALGGLLLGLVGSLGVVPATGSAVAAPAAARGYVPADGVILNDPTVRARRHVIHDTVVRSIRNTPRGEYVRLAAWNYDSRPLTDVLLAAHGRGVHVQVVTNNEVVTAPLERLKTSLDADLTDESFVVKCSGGCRSRSKIMHSKFFLFSNVSGARNISMFGSPNLVAGAGSRQWNDMVITKNPRLYAFMVKTFEESVRDRAVPGDPYTVFSAGRFQVTLFPAGTRNPQLRELRKVRCLGATGGTGNGAGRTRIRIAIAGWFDSYGTDIAERVRYLWNQGCDIRIITTRTGRGVNQTLRAPGRRGPVPIRRLAPDLNGDGIPDKYLHMKAMTISGVYDGDRAASVVFTGSPNWSLRAQRSEEAVFRMVESPGLLRRYAGHIDALFRSPLASTQIATPTVDARRAARMPDWYDVS